MAVTTSTNGVPAPQIAARVGLSRMQVVGILAALAVAIVLPFVVTDFRVFQFTMALGYAIAILGLNLLTGYNGQFSLGHGAFYAVGAYTAAILMDHWEVPYYWTIPVAGLVSFVVGFLFGFPALRLEGLYLALATFALAVATPQILKFDPLEEWTGGVQGIIIFKPDPPSLVSSLSQDQWLYFLTLGILLVMFFLAWNLLRGRTGRAMMAIRDNPIAAKTMGVNLAFYKTLSFGLSAFYTGISGALGAIVVGFVAPDSFTLFLSITLLVGLVVGGLASIPGAIFGGLFVLFIPNVSEVVSDWLALATGQDIGKGFTWGVYGIFMILFMYFMPSGIWGFLRRLYGLALTRARG